MKRFLISAVAIVFLACSMAMAACTKASSTAVTIDELIRENYAAEREAEDDAKGREHIEIPDDAEEIEIDGETWNVIRSIEEFRQKIFRADNKGLTESFILANDIDLKGFKPNKTKIFKGHLNGNNYKFYGTEETGGFRHCLFNIIENATIENVIFSASDGYEGELGLSELRVFIAWMASDCTIRNCINYFQPKNELISCGGFIKKAYDCKIDNCTNYADLITPGGIVNFAVDCRITNCINYGNLSSSYEGGGIVGEVYKGCVIESCINYGNIIGCRYKGGIVGNVSLGITGSPLSEENYTNNQIVKDCKNYGDIYVLEEKDTNRLEHLDYVMSEDLYCIGGIAGSMAKVENCINEGNFYGFESFGKGINVDYSGGIVGIAKEVINCTSTYTIPVQKGRAKNVGEIYGILL